MIHMLLRKIVLISAALLLCLNVMPSIAYASRDIIDKVPTSVPHTSTDGLYKDYIQTICYDKNGKPMPINHHKNVSISKHTPNSDFAFYTIQFSENDGMGFQEDSANTFIPQRSIADVLEIDNTYQERSVAFLSGHKEDNEEIESVSYGSVPSEQQVTNFIKNNNLGFSAIKSKVKKD